MSFGAGGSEVIQSMNLSVDDEAIFLSIMHTRAATTA
jgi:hypothetical protein